MKKLHGEDSGKRFPHVVYYLVCPNKLDIHRASTAWFIVAGLGKIQTKSSVMKYRHVQNITQTRTFPFFQKLFDYREGIYVKR